MEKKNTTAITVLSLTMSLTGLFIVFGWPVGLLMTVGAAIATTVLL